MVPPFMLACMAREHVVNSRSDPQRRLRGQHLDIPFQIVLIEPEIPPNTGNIARLCAATRSRLHLVGKLGFRIDEHAVRRVYELKGRPPANPLIVHVADVRMAREVVADWPAEAQRIADACWPGPVTIVLPRSSRMPDIVTGGRATVGVRCPDHEVAIALLERLASPLVGPSVLL